MVSLEFMKSCVTVNWCVVAISLSIVCYCIDCVQIQMKNPEDAKYLENTISANDMRAFIFEDDDDLRQFDEIMRKDLKLKVNVLNMIRDCTSESFKPQFPIENYRLLIALNFTLFQQPVFRVRVLHGLLTVILCC